MSCITYDLNKLVYFSTLIGLRLTHPGGQGKCLRCKNGNIASDFGTIGREKGQLLQEYFLQNLFTTANSSSLAVHCCFQLVCLCWWVNFRWLSLPVTGLGVLNCCCLLICSSSLLHFGGHSRSDQTLGDISPSLACGRPRLTPYRQKHCESVGVSIKCYYLSPLLSYDQGQK